MNIVKFKDIKIDGDELFNSEFRGKYCYCLRWKYCISFDVINTSEYMIFSSAEEDDLPEHILFEDYKIYADEYATARANSIDQYVLANRFIPSEMTLEEIKKFRTKVAKMIAEVRVLWDEEYKPEVTGAQRSILLDRIDAVLNYYSNGMYDKTMSMLSIFSEIPSIGLNGTFSDCGCSSTAGISAIGKSSTAQYQVKTGCSCNSAVQLGSAQICDCGSLYAEGIRNYMIQLFSDISFWSLMTETVVLNIINMLKAITEAGLSVPAAKSSSNLIYGDCSCLADSADDTNAAILNNLIKSFEYIRDGETVSHKNFITNSLYAWSSKLYERMEWTL